MTYQVPRNGRIPFVTSTGLGEPIVEGGALPSDPAWVRIAGTLGTPFAQALSSRIAYGSSPPLYGSGFEYLTPQGSYSGGAVGGFDPSTLLLLGGGALLLVMLMGRK